MRNSMNGIRNGSNRGYEALGNKYNQNDNSAEIAEEGARQQRKVIAAFLGGVNGELNRNAIVEKDINLPDGAREEFLNRIRSGDINTESERRLLEIIADPISRSGTEAVKNQLMDKHELRILGHMTGGVFGFNNWRNLDASGVEAFVQRYPLPTDFEGASASFLANIEAANGKKKRAEYEQAMQSFKQKIYGKRQEYWDQIKVLNDEAYSNTRMVPEASESVASREQNEVASLKNIGRKALGAFANLIGGLAKPVKPTEANEVTSPTNSAEVAMGIRPAERERSSEWISGAAAMLQVAKSQVRGGQVNMAELQNGLWDDGTSQDTMLMRGRDRVYGAFDGVGGLANGRLASQIAAAVIDDVCERGFTIETGEDLAKALNFASDMVYRRLGQNGGATTAALAKVVELGDGTKYLAYASAGDSRIYIVNAKGEARQITEDEGEGNRIWNSLGLRLSGQNGCVRKFGNKKLNEGDRIVVCTDGITGDYAPDLMSPETIGDIVSRARNPREAASVLAATATKKDDRGVIVAAV